MPSKPNTVQKRPSGQPRLEYAPINLPQDFPISISGIHRQADAEITRLHLHDCLEIGYCRSGSGIFVIESKVLPFRKDDLCIITDEEMHLARSTKGTVSEWEFIMLNPARMLSRNVDDPAPLGTAGLSGQSFRNIIHGSDNTPLRDLVLQLISELRQKAVHYRDTVRALVWAISIHLHRLEREGKPRAAAGRHTEIERIVPALHHISSGYAEPVSIPRLAQLCHMSPTHFRRIFAKAVGCSPLEYLTRFRIRMATALLESTDRKILDISQEVGYETLSSFNRHFKTVTGMSPRAMKKQLG